MSKSKTSKLKASLATAIVSVLYTFVNGLFALIINQKLISKFGSDFNGINTVAMQIISVLLIFESGYSLASNVALFGPLSKNDFNAVSKVITTTKRAFKRIGVLYFLFGIAFAIIYAILAKSSLNNEIVFSIVLMAILPSGLNLIFSMQYTVLFQANQKEYLIYLFKLISVVLGQIIVFIVCNVTSNILIIRAVMMIPYLIAIIITICTGRHTYRRKIVPSKPDSSLLKGTNDLMVQRFVGIIYTSMPSILISIRISSVMASVYGVYVNVTALLKSLASAVIQAPRMSIGAMLSNNDNTSAKKTFAEYQTLVLHTITAISVVYFTVIMDFIAIYTKGFTDVHYQDNVIAMLLGLIFWFECLHLPSGIVISMSGRFSIAKKIQIIAGIMLVIFLTFGALMSSLHFIILAVLIAAITLAVLEIGYVHTVVFEKTGAKFITDSLACILSAFLAVLILSSINFTPTTYFMLVIKAFIAFVFAIIIDAIILHLYDKQQLKVIISYLKLPFRLYKLH